MKRNDALNLSHSMDTERKNCPYCARKLATSYDASIFDHVENGLGGERPDLCWSIESDTLCDEYKNMAVLLRDFADDNNLTAENIVAFVHRTFAYAK